MAVGQPDRGPGIGRIAAALLEELAKVARCLLWALTGVRDSGSFPLENHLLYPKETPCHCGTFPSPCSYLPLTEALAVLSVVPSPAD